jgi:hypothetical protein
VEYIFIGLHQLRYLSRSGRQARRRARPYVLGTAGQFDGLHGAAEGRDHCQGVRLPHLRRASLFSSNLTGADLTGAGGRQVGLGDGLPFGKPADSTLSRALVSALSPLSLATTGASGPRNALNKRSQPGNAAEAPLSETVHASSCRSISVARGSRDGADQRAWDGHRLGCRGRPPSHDTSHVVRSGAVF